MGSLALGAVIFGEAPTAPQLAGAAAILAGLVLVARVRAPASEGI
jgi:drug/metabolite transporter (DMT)-like permease